MNYSGLDLIVRRQRWRWIGMRELPSVIRRKTERLERWECACSSCGGPLVKLARIPDDLLRTYLQRRAEGNVALVVRDGLIEQLEQSSCRRCEREAVPA